MANTSTWAERIAQWRASGLSAREFCAAQGLSKSALYFWSNRLNQHVPTAIVPLARVKRASTSSGTDGSATERLVVEFDGTRLFVPAGVEREQLMMVIDVVQRRAAR